MTNGRVELFSAACPSPSSCVAAGYYQTYQDGYAQNYGLIVTGAGSKWNVGASVAGQLLDSVSCPAISSCTVSGSTLLAGAGTSRRSINVGTLGGDQFASVSCPSASACAAAASSPSHSSSQGAVLTGAGQAWTPTFVTLPQGIGWADLSSISCSTATACVAVGASDTEAGVLMTGPA